MVPNALKEFFCWVKWWFNTDRLSNIQAIGGKNETEISETLSVSSARSNRIYPYRRF
jgi:hypothetical protein